MNEKEYINKYCKYCTNKDEDDMCNIVRDIDGNAKCVNYKEYSSMNKNSLILEIGRLQGKIEYLEQEEKRLRKENAEAILTMKHQKGLIDEYEKMLYDSNEMYIKKSVIKDKIKNLNKIKSIPNVSEDIVNCVTKILEDLLENKE